ncbi:MAG: histone deacetylase family protein [Alphaproteobacteria bacterium]|nr:histone deacetylase family protein [Alphaproteobacteria bacterium]
MQTILYTHDACLEHDPGEHHPESPARLRAVLAAMEAEEFQHLDRRPAPHAEVDQIARVHDRNYVQAVLDAIPESGRRALDGDTHVSPGSGEAALRAAGAVCAAVDAVAAGEARNAFCAVRPPGHHAEQSIAMGFCLFNNVAVGAAHAQAMHGLDRVAVIDFDVHHGNGTQAMFWENAEQFYASTHQYPLYPGTGGRDEHGKYNNIVNAPLEPSSGSGQFRDAITETVIPAVQKFAPDIVFISAGFDAHRADPLAMLNLETEDFEWATAALAGVAGECCKGRVVSTLEGGYDLGALAASAAAHVRALMTS